MAPAFYCTASQRDRSHRSIKILCALLLALVWLYPSTLWCQTALPTQAVEEKSAIQINAQNLLEDKKAMPIGDESPTVTLSIVSKSAVLIGLALAPFVVMLLTSFIKIVIVLSLLRNAIGSQQTPPNQIINGVAIILTLYVMFPTGLAMYESSKEVIDNYKPKEEIVSGETALFILEVIAKAKEPLREFMLKHTERQHLQTFYQISHRVTPLEYREKLQPQDYIILLPSFITSQIKNAFEVSVMIYLPFFVVDLVTSNILLAMGMQMLSPMTISLPLKLLLLVMVDGWTLIIEGLVLSYQ